MNNKRGQFYLIAAIIIIGALIGVVTVTNFAITRQSADEIKVYQLSQELKLESEQVINYGILTSSLDTALSRFTEEYSSYIGDQENDVYFIYGDKKSIAKPFQSIIGLDNVNNIYLFQKEIPFQSITANNQYIMKYLETGKLSKTSFVEFEKNALFVNNYYLTNDGRIITYIIKEDKINFVKILL